MVKPEPIPWFGLSWGLSDPTARPPDPTWVRRFLAWELASTLMDRLYVEIGLQPILGWEAADAPGVHLASPGCLQAPRYFGYTDGVTFTPSHELADVVNLGLGGIRVEPVCVEAFGDGGSGRPFTLSTPGELSHEEFEVLGLDWRDPEEGHEGCPHRSGSLFPEHMFRMATLARLHRWGADDFDRGFIASLPTSSIRKLLMVQDVKSRSTLADFGWLAEEPDSDPRAPGAPTAYVVFPSAWEGLRVLHFDGTMSGGFQDGADLVHQWRRGDDYWNIVAEIFS